MSTLQRHAENIIETIVIELRAVLPNSPFQVELAVNFKVKPEDAEKIHELVTKVQEAIDMASKSVSTRYTK